MTEQVEKLSLTPLQFINNNVEAGQQVRGAFNLVQCREYENCMKTLNTFFSAEEKLAKQEEVNALATLINLCEVQQSKGVFSIRGSVMILEALESLNEEMDKFKDPALKFKELQEKVSRKSKK